MSKTIFTDRNLGDCEIRSISFSDETAMVEIFDPMKSSSFKIVFKGIFFLRFETNHAQNVIDSMVIFSSLASLTSDFASAHFVDNIPLDVPKDAKVAYIRPIAGGESLIAFREFEIRE